MITIHSINLKQINEEPCFASIGRNNGCRVLSSTNDGRGTYSLPFYKPRNCKEWIRIDDRTGVNLIPPEDIGEK